jgi:hypothetical protein
MPTKGKNLARVEQDRLLDEVLEQTFPASDPIALQDRKARFDEVLPHLVSPGEGSGVTVASR